MYTDVLKKHLDEIIDNLDVDIRLRDRYKKFDLYLSKDTKKTYSGVYYPSIRTIVIPTTPEHKNANQVSTLLHELAHHCDDINRGKSDHGTEFYKMFAMLLYSALDLGKIEYEDALNLAHINSDYTKVIKILRQYQPRLPLNKKKNDLVHLIVKNVKENVSKLKLFGYEFNERGNYWFRAMIPGVTDYEIKTLQQYGFTDYEIVDSNKIHIIDDKKLKQNQENAVDEIVIKAIKEWIYLKAYIARKVANKYNLNDLAKLLNGSPVYRESSDEGDVMWFEYDYVSIQGKIIERMNGGKSEIYLDNIASIYNSDGANRSCLLEDVDMEQIKLDMNM